VIRLHRWGCTAGGTLIIIHLSLPYPFNLGFIIIQRGLLQFILETACDEHVIGSKINGGGGGTGNISSGQGRGLN
jgi:hypothetical protein